EPAGAPSKVRIEDNVVRGNTGVRARAVRIEVQGPDNVFVNNQVSGNTDDSVPLRGQLSTGPDRR
ncbi:MAG TPA: hypothetical protein VMZ90_02090, partial [Vicinamibacterales bacterium]|nr:hypothetical protein [Vicinamibacterales bacterium]